MRFGFLCTILLLFVGTVCAEEQKKAEPKKEDPAKKSVEALVDCSKRLDKQLDEADNLDTTTKKELARQKAFHALAKELKSIDLTFKFTVDDVTPDGVLTVESDVEDVTLNETFRLRLKKGEAAQIAKGDILTLTGKAIFLEPSPKGNGGGVGTQYGRDIAVGETDTFSFGLHNFKYEIKHPKAEKAEKPKKVPAPPMPQK